jgi:tellurite resistance protein TerC
VQPGRTRLAILGLRALYFLLAGMTSRFVYLKIGLAAVVVFVGAEMLLADVFHVAVWLSLAVIAAVLGVSVVGSLRATLEAEPVRVDSLSSRPATSRR